MLMPGTHSLCSCLGLILYAQLSKGRESPNLHCSFAAAHLVANSRDMAAPGAAGEIDDQTDEIASAAEEQLVECTSRFPVELDEQGLPLCSAVLRRKK